MQHYFDECPDCGEYYGKVGNMPEIERDKKTYYNGYYIVESGVKTICNRCGWETQLHDNVGQCAEEWNNAKLYEEDVEEDSDYLRKARRMAGNVMEELNRLDRTGEALYAFVRQLRYVSRMYAYRDAMKAEYDFEIVPADEYKKLKDEQ